MASRPKLRVHDNKDTNILMNGIFGQPDTIKPVDAACEVFAAALLVTPKLG